MAGGVPTHRTEAQREEDLLKITRWYLANETQAWMATQLGVSAATVHTDIQEIKKRWLNSSLVNYDEKMNLILARIDWIEYEAIEAWKRSKTSYEENVGTQVEMVTEEKGKEKKQPQKRTTKIARKQRDGSAVWLSQVAWCVEQRCKLFDLYASKDLTPTEIQEIMHSYAEAVRRDTRNEYQAMREQQTNGLIH